MVRRMSQSSLLVVVHELAPRIRAAALQIEQGRRLLPELAVELAQQGLFRMCVPQALGGLEVDAATLVRVIEATAIADGSTGWCVMIGATSGMTAAYLPAAAGRTMYATPTAIAGGVFAPMGKAIQVDGGYRVSGRWSFASGCQHCDWLMGGCVIIEDGKPRMLPAGVPETRMMLFPAGAAEVHDTWDVAGLRGTGSHDIRVHDLFVPAEFSVSFTLDRPQYPGRLYAFPVFGLLALGIAGVALGIARRAIDELCGLATDKTPTGSRRKLVDRAVVQMQVAQAEAQLRAARALVFDTIDDSWQAAATAPLDLTARALLRLAATHATATAAQVVDLMYSAGGGSAIYAHHPLQRCLRDVHVATQHMMVAQPTYELTGRVLLGVETDTTLL